PRVQPRSAAMRDAIARAATRRGWSRITGPSLTSAGGTRVVLPAPGAAVITAARHRLTSATMSSRKGSIGRGSIRSPAEAGEGPAEAGHYPVSEIAEPAHGDA